MTFTEADIKKIYDRYDEGNQLVREGEYDLAITVYDQVIDVLPDFPLAYFNRAFARILRERPDETYVEDEEWDDSEQEEEDWREYALDDLWAALILGFDESFAHAIDEESFYLGLAAHVVEADGYLTLLEWCDDEDVSTESRHQLKEKLLFLLQEDNYLVQELFDAQIDFDPDYLGARAVIAEIFLHRADPEPVLPDAFQAYDSKSEIADPELAWRLPFLLGWIIYCSYSAVLKQNQLWVVDDWSFRHRFAMGEEERAFLVETIKERKPAEGSVTDIELLTEFAQELLFEAALDLCELRASRVPPAGEAENHWTVASDLFKALIDTTFIREDAASAHRAIELARYFGALVGVREWIGSSPDRDVPASPAERCFFSSFQPSPSPNLKNTLDRDDLLLEFFVYEEGTDQLVTVSHDQAGTSVANRALDSNDVVLLLMISRQWAIPPSKENDGASVKSSSHMEEVTGTRDPRIVTDETLQQVVINQSMKDPWLLAHQQDPDNDQSIRRMIMAAYVASSDIPVEGYPLAANEAILNEDVKEKVKQARRLLVIPFSYLHNIPFHLMPSIQNAIRAGSLEELVVLPSLSLLSLCQARVPAERNDVKVLFVGLEVAGSVDAEKEHKAILRFFPKAVALVGEDARKDDILATMRDFDIVHIACHGGFDWERNSPYLQVSDGRIYPDEFLVDSLDIDLLVLNACISGVVSRDSRDGDQTLGFPAALLAGGVRQVIAPLWEVEEVMALEFCMIFYSTWKSDTGDSVARILLGTQEHLRRLPGKADPYFWAPHVLFGDWR